MCRARRAPGAGGRAPRPGAARPDRADAVARAIAIGYFPFRPAGLHVVATRPGAGGNARTGPVSAARHIAVSTELLAAAGGSVARAVTAEAVSASSRPGTLRFVLLLSCP